MKKFTIGVLMALSVFPTFPAFSASGEEGLTPAQQEAVRQAVQDYLKEHGSPGAAMPPMAQPGTAPDPPASGKNLQELGTVEGKRQKADSSMTGSGGLIYARPFVSSPKAIVGGYMDFEYLNKKNSGPSTFDIHRFVPFIYADVSENVKMAAELEIEHGIREGTETEISLEFATVDYLIKEPFNLRAGVLLLPVGKFNLLHDSPLRDLTERPLVDTYIIPTTLSETGVGFYGTVYPSRLSKLDYEFYVTTGFNGYSGDDGCVSGSDYSTCSGVITEEKGIKDARQRKTGVSDGFDNNNGKSIVGRLAYSPILGVEIGGSGYYGSYDPKSKRSLSIMAVDWTLQRGPFELIGEAAWTYVKDNSKSLTGGPAIDPNTGRPLPQRMNGYYIQGNYHFLPEWLTRLAPNHFRPEVSTFTAVVRWEETNTNLDHKKGLGQYQRLTFGLNFRPTEDTVYKLDYQYSPETPISKNGETVRGNDHGFVASVATYF
ncbi:MAG: hypothetical protein KC587_09150 [Nitrospira sp.]|nr:hypothetical protein [Nitrospira sp.]MCA9456817.1 hypothetical protein [Nitrospira sp.]